VTDTKTRRQKYGNMETWKRRNIDLWKYRKSKTRRREGEAGGEEEVLGYVTCDYTSP
jgi:hypothetical protein